MFFKKRGLTFKQSLYILTATALIFIPVVVFICVTTGNIMFKDTQKIAEGITAAKANELDQNFLLAMKFAEQTALMLEDGHYSLNGLHEILETSMSGMRRIRGSYGCSITFAPYAFKPDKKYFMLYTYRQHHVLINKILGGKNYDYLKYDWFKIPFETGNPTWIKPYYDRGGGNILMTTYSAPFYKTINGHRKFQGVVTIDIALKWLNAVVSTMKLFPSAEAFIIARNGLFISHTNAAMIMTHNLREIAEQYGDQQFIDNVDKILAGKKGFFPHYAINRKKNIWTCYTPLKTTKWSLAVSFPENELFAGLVTMEIKVVIMSLLGFILLFWVVLIITVRVTRPLKQLTETAGQIAAGNFTTKVPQLASHDEIALLSQSFASMQRSLVEYIDHLATTTAAKEKIESELNIARDIQLKILPDSKNFPAYSEFTLASFIKSAKAVGGDLYDFFFIDETRLCVAIGDVSGKGVPAALFMSGACKLLRGITESSMTTGELMTRLSKGMGYNNDMMMFITCFFAILDVKTGMLEYTNAGHNPPYMIKAGGKPVEIIERHGPPLAIADIEYSSSTLIMSPGDTLMLYTDGVNEAMNCNHEQFGNEQMVKVLQAQNYATPQRYIDAMQAALSKFTADFEPSDDITMLVITYNGKK